MNTSHPKSGFPAPHHAHFIPGGSAWTLSLSQIPREGRGRSRTNSCSSDQHLMHRWVLERPTIYIAAGFKLNVSNGGLLGSAKPPGRSRGLFPLLTAAPTVCSALEPVGSGTCPLRPVWLPAPSLCVLSSCKPAAPKFYSPHLKKGQRALTHSPGCEELPLCDMNGFVSPLPPKHDCHLPVKR